jgi:hypothetical protein
MVTLIQREFTVAVPMQKAWDHLARVEQRDLLGPTTGRVLRGLA